MNAAAEKSTARALIDESISLDGRLALFHESSQWLAVSDIHFGYEITRRADGGLYPMWGMETIEARLDSLIADYSPKTLILNGDTVDSGSASDEAISWIESIHERIERVVLVAGNHDRGLVRRHFSFVPQYSTDGFFFHHGHLSPEVPAGHVEVIGHLHPSLSVTDGAGLRLRMPSLVQDRGGEHTRWAMPAFSPWAGGGKYRRPEGNHITEWACTRQRVFPFDL